MPKLHFTDKNFNGRVYELLVEKTTVGRGEHNTLVIADTSVSVNHCEILSHGEELIVRERNSSNGTFVDGIRVQGQMPLHNGQILRFGSVEARVEIPPPPGSDTATDLTAVYEYGKVMREQRREKKKVAAAHSRIEPSSDAAAPEESHTVLLPNPRATQRMQVVAPAPPVPDAEEKPRRTSGGYVLVAVIAIVAVIIIWWFRQR